MAKQLQQQQQQLTNRQVIAANLHGGTIPACSASGQMNILNYLTRKSPQTPAQTPQAQQNGIRITQTTVQQQPQSQQHQQQQQQASVGTENGTDKKVIDEDSQKGHFGWATFGKINIPYIVRQPTEKYCAVRMVEMKLLNKYLSYLHSDIYSSCTCVRSYSITEAESRLLNEINHKHCDAQFGRELFTRRDLVVRLSDANKFYQFLDICYRKLLTGNKSPSDKCGFIRINKESVVPYTVRNNEQVVPLFYFEGETENLRQKAEYLAGWDLAYLKFCCKVQGIRNELFSSESVAVISLTDIKTYFPTGTEFEDYWPSKVVDSNLLIASKNLSNHVHWTRQPSQPPSVKPAHGPQPQKTIQQQQQQQQHQQQQQQQQQHQQQQQQQQQKQQTRNTAYPVQVQAANAQNLQRIHANTLANSGLTAAAMQAIANGSWPIGATPSSLTSMLTLQAQAHRQQSQRGYPTAGNQMPNLMAARQFNYNNTQLMAAISCSPQQQQQPPPLVRSTPQGAHAMPQVAVANATLQQQHQQQQQQSSSTLQNGRQSQANASQVSAAMHLKRHAAAASQAIDVNQRLCVIPELPGGMSVHVPPYKVQNVCIDNVMVPCINLKSYNDADQLMTLTDFQKLFFPNVPIDHCRRFLEALGPKMYKPNRMQVQTLIDSGRQFSENIPLIQVRDILEYMPQLQYMMRSNQLAQEQPPSKRTRMS